MKKTKFSVHFFKGLESQFTVSLELPNSVNPIEILSQFFVDYRVANIDARCNTISLVLIDGEEEVR